MSRADDTAADGGPSTWPDTRPERMWRLRDARVVLADYDLLQRDFPELQAAANRLPGRGAARRRAVESLIDRWLVSIAAVASQPQVRQTLVNSEIPVTGELVRCHRPPGYGRACIVPVKSEGSGTSAAAYLDVKGVGVATGRRPRPEPHADGLIDLDVVFNEVILQRLIEAVLRRAGGAYGALPFYAILDAGFDMTERWTGYGLARPAALLVRRFHRRFDFGQDLPRRHSFRQHVQSEIEFLLRQFGFTSVNPSTSLELRKTPEGAVELRMQGRVVTGYEPAQVQRLWRSLGCPEHMICEGVNVQTSRSVRLDPPMAELVDFGHYTVRARFEHPVLSLVSDRPLRWGGLLTADHPSYVQPDPAFALDAAAWRLRSIPKADARRIGLPGPLSASGPRRAALMATAAWRARGAKARDWIRRHLDGYVTELIAHWPA